MTPQEKLYRQRWLAKGGPGVERALARWSRFWSKVDAYDKQRADAGLPRQRDRRRAEQRLNKRAQGLREKLTRTQG